MASNKNPYIRYSNMAIQMAVIIGLGAWGGKKLDETYPNEHHIWTIVLSLTSIFAALYLVLKDLIKPKK